MNRILALLSLLGFLSATALADPEPQAAPQGKPYILYAEFTENTAVELSNGAKWMMDKGDCFPIHMFTEHRTKVVLQLGPATFTTEAKHLRIMKETENGPAQVSYQKNLDEFAKTQAADAAKTDTAEKK